MAAVPPTGQAPAAPQPERFGDYWLLRKIGQGGMAEVFLAKHHAAEANTAPVVIKRLHQQLERDQNAVDLFLTEADVTALLKHPNVIRVLDSGEANSRYYMCLEYVHGKDLEQLFDRYRAVGKLMDPNMAVHVLIRVLRGLDYAHTAKTASGRPLGLVHRDVTPSNIYVSSQGQIKLGDFGVAKLVGVEGWTMAGSIKGKLGYLSPEQIAGEQPAKSIDLWAAGVILFELLAGQRLFVGEAELDVMLRIKNAKVPRLRRINKAAPRQLERILKTALHRKERKRFATAGAFADALEEYQTKYGKAFSEKELVTSLVQALSG